MWRGYSPVRRAYSPMRRAYSPMRRAYSPMRRDYSPLGRGYSPPRPLYDRGYVPPYAPLPPAPYGSALPLDYPYGGSTSYPPLYLRPEVGHPYSPPPAHVPNYSAYPADYPSRVDDRWALMDR